MGALDFSGIKKEHSNPTQETQQTNGMGLPDDNAKQGTDEATNPFVDVNVKKFNDIFVKMASAFITPLE